MMQNLFYLDYYSICLHNKEHPFEHYCPPLLLRMYLVCLTILLSLTLMQKSTKVSIEM